MEEQETTTAARDDLRSRYEALRNLLDRNGALLELMADLELDLRLSVPGNPLLWARTRSLLDKTLLQVQTLNLLSENRHTRLYGVWQRIEDEIWRTLRDLYEECRSTPLIAPLAQASREDVLLVGGKAARLGELANVLSGNVPSGFVVTTAAYTRFLAHGEISASLREILKDVDVLADPLLLQRRADRACELVLAQDVPEVVSEAIEDAAQRLRASGSPQRWAVRSSAVGEDGPSSFAGQFESVLDVPEHEIVSAWRRVVASVFSHRALSFRVACGAVSELAMPMAVLCMPMVDARWAGVLCTRDPGTSTECGEATMLVSAVRGLASELVGGTEEGSTFRVSREHPERPLAASGDAAETPPPDGFRGPESAALVSLVGLARAAQTHFEEDLELEWAVDVEGEPYLLQARPLASANPRRPERAEVEQPVIAAGGSPVVTGRAVGEVCVIESWVRVQEVPGGCVLVIPHATPEFGHLLPRVEGLIAEHGSVAGHLASLAREFGVPAVFGMTGAASRLPRGEVVSLDAGRAKVYAGDVWPGEEPAARHVERQRRAVSATPLHTLVLSLGLTDPRSPSFRPRGCRSIHDIVRFCHERGVAALFEAHAWRERPEQSGALRLAAPRLPIDLWVLDTGGGIAPAARGQASIDPDEVVSLPFHALWRGMTAPGVEWSGRTTVSLRGFASVVSSSMLEREADPGSLATQAYMVVGSRYLNLNARLAYHFAMIDAVVGEVTENNQVRFRFWGGGAMPAQRDLRALFLAQVLQELGFMVERRGDLVVAALRRHSAARSQAGLEALGKLMGCARQLDMLLDGEARVKEYAGRFLAGDYGAFA